MCEVKSLEDPGIVDQPTCVIESADSGAGGDRLLVNFIFFVFACLALSNRLLVAFVYFCRNAIESLFSLLFFVV